MPTRPDYQIAIATFIVNREARRDQRGKLAIYRLPKADGGGTFEVAGINDRYHPAKAAQLRDLINKGLPDQAEAIRSAETIILPPPAALPAVTVSGK